MPYEQVYTIVRCEKRTGLRKPVEDHQDEPTARQRCKALNSELPEGADHHFVLMRGNKEMRFASEKSNDQTG